MTGKLPPSADKLAQRAESLAKAREHRAAQSRAATDLIRTHAEVQTALLRFKITKARLLSAGSSGELVERCRLEYDTELRQLGFLKAELDRKMQDRAVLAEAKKRMAKAENKRLQTQAEIPPPVQVLDIPDVSPINHNRRTT